MTFSHSSGAMVGVVVTVGGAIPALATATSSAPKRSTVAATRAASPRVGDVGADPDRPLADPLRRLARLIGVEVDDRDRGAAHVELPRALWAPIARGAPVTSATLPFRS